MKVEFSDDEIETLMEIMDVAIRAEGVSIAEKCTLIILKLKVSKANENKVEEAEVESTQQKVARKSPKNDSRTT